MIGALQALMRWGFMQVEALFNRAFGDRLNPYYHLGSLTFFLFWIVAGTGLYLFAFFDTSVTGAYQSVEGLTHRQWFLGGIVRSVHRYASDAMVVTMVIHMLRYFAFDRLRGFRWVSWVTGVALIWLVYVAGANGYMLPWDQLAQDITVTSFEWLDWLPIFNGSLMRNFLYSDHVGARFFTLLSFMHLGIPLVLLMVMWIHVQRVPKARTTPPRDIVIGLLATMLLLSLLAPVHSQGGDADLARGLAMHIAAMNPPHNKAADVPAEFVAKEKEIELAKMSDKDKAKPADILEKIISGKINKIINEVTLYGQPYVLDSDKSVEQVVKAAGADVVGFQRLVVGEGIEKVVEDYAAEVMKQAGLA